MSTREPRTTDANRSGLSGQRWVVPVACVMFGFGYLVVGVANGRTTFGVTGLVVMVVYGSAMLLLRHRSEPAALLVGDQADERRAQIQLRTAATTGYVLLVVVVAGVFWSLATQNRYEGVFALLAAVGGGTFIASTVWFSRRG